MDCVCPHVRHAPKVHESLGESTKKQSLTCNRWVCDASACIIKRGNLADIFVRFLYWRRIWYSSAAVAGRARGRSGIRPGWESTVWRVEERASLVKSTQPNNCRTAVRTRGLIRPRFTRLTPDGACEHDHRAGRHLAPLGVSARRFQAAGPKHRASSPGVRSRINR